MLFRNALGEVLKESRLSQGKTLRTVSKDAFMALGYLSEVERGQKELSSEPMENLARALGMDSCEVVFKAAMKMAGVEVPNSPAEILDGYPESMLR